MSTDIMDLLKAADPLTEADESAHRLANIRALLDQRVAEVLPAVAPDRARSRVPMLIAAAAGVVAIVVGLSLVRPGGGLTLAGTAAALTNSGEITCARQSTPVTELTPQSAPLRLLPTSVPAGWTVTGIRVTSTAASPCDATPALTAAVIGRDDAVQSSVMIRGPLDFSIDTGHAAVTPATIGGSPGVVLTLDDPKGPQERIWVWQVDGHTWYMKSYGFDNAGNNALAAAVQVTGDQVALDPSAASRTPRSLGGGREAGLQIISARAGQAPAVQPQEEWYVGLGRGTPGKASTEVVMRVVGMPGAPLGFDGVFPGQTLTREEGNWVLQQHAYGAVNLFQSRPGVLVTLDAPPGGQPSLGAMSPQQWLTMVRSLEPVAANDPRLSSIPTLALDQTPPALTHDPAITEATVAAIGLPDPAPGFPERVDTDNTAHMIFPPNPRDGWGKSFSLKNPTTGTTVLVLVGDIDPKAFIPAGATVVGRPTVSGVKALATRTQDGSTVLTRLVLVRGKLTVAITASGQASVAQLVTLAESLTGMR